MVSCQELQDLNLSTLNTATVQWRQMLAKLVTLADGADGGTSAAALERRAAGADWKGDNATVTKEFTTRTAREFDDMVTEARSIHAVLRDAHTELRKHQSDLRAAIDRWAKRNVRIEGTGTVRSALGPTERDRQPQPTQEDIDTAAAEIAAILTRAQETDRIAARALRRHAKSKYDFDESGYRGLKDADRQQGIADADALVRLAGKGPDLSEAELKRFHQIAKYHGDNPAFAERFTTGLGAQGTLDFWRGLADPGTGRTPDGDRAKLLTTVQNTLSNVLADASHSDSHAMRQWKTDVMALGGELFDTPGSGSAPYGFQVMAPLLSEGKWDTEFLTQYGEKLIEFERDETGTSNPGSLWGRYSGNAQLSYPPDGPRFQEDPVAGLMEALGHNPEASARFFNDGTSGSGAGGLKEMSHWEYLVEGTGNSARDWPDNIVKDQPAFAQLGHALESGTLGYPYDAKEPTIPPLRTEADFAARAERLELMEKTVVHYKSADAIDAQAGMRDSLTKMAAGHIDSLNYTMANWAGGGESSDSAKVFGAERNALKEFTNPDSAQFLRALASDENSHRALSAAQEVYATSTAVTHGDDRASAKNALMNSMTMHGIFDEARTESIGKEFADEKEQRNRELAKSAEWDKFQHTTLMVGLAGAASYAAVAAAPAFIVAVPLAVEIAGSAAATQQSVEIIDRLKRDEFDNSQKSIEDIDKANYAGQSNSLRQVTNWANSEGFPSAEITEIRRDAEAAYDIGKNRVDTDNARGH